MNTRRSFFRCLIAGALAIVAAPAAALTPRPKPQPVMVVSGGGVGDGEWCYGGFWDEIARRHTRRLTPDELAELFKE